MDDMSMRRAAIFFFYDKDGKVDSYVSYLLKGIIASLERLVIVSNGKLSNEGKKKLEEFSSEIIERENIGLDVGAYQTALDYIGWNTLEEYDEIIIFNHTIMGPVYPFEEMFEEMDKRNVDFWGITKYGKEGFDPFGCNPYGYIPEHIQSHFMSFRKSLIINEEFKKYWKNMPVIKSYNESVGLFESTFTKKFSDLGFKWDVYVNTDEYERITTHPIIFYPKELIKDKRCPIFKRRSFFQPFEYVIANTVAQSAVELMQYLEENKLYDTDMIWENILRTCNQADIMKNLQLEYVLPSNIAPIQTVSEELKKKKITLVMHLYFEDLIDSSFEYAQAMPDETDIYITTNTEQKKRSIEKKFSEGTWNKVEVRVIENRGRDVSSVLVGVKDVIMDYDIACFVHDKKAAQSNPGSIGEGFAYKCFSNILYNKNFVYNVIECFVKNPRLGLLSPPVPHHGDYFPILGREWSINFQNVKKLAEELNITVPIEENKEPIAPLGTFFWFRPKALAPLYAHDWTYEEFPPEPNNIDGTMLHAIERLYPFAAQQAGYYPAVVVVDKYAGIELNTLAYYAREYNKILLDHNMGGYQHMMVKYLDETLTACPEWKKAAEEYIHVNNEYQAILKSSSWKVISKINHFIDILMRRNSRL